MDKHLITELTVQVWWCTFWSVRINATNAGLNSPAYAATTKPYQNTAQPGVQRSVTRVILQLSLNYF